MKNILHILILTIFISCSNNIEQKANSIETISKIKIIKKSIIKVDTARIDKYSKELKEWLDHYDKYSINLTDFEFVNEMNLPDITVTVDTFDLAKDIYEPFYKYSPDNSIVLDLTSYNLILVLNNKNEYVSYAGEVDSEVSIKDLKNKKWQRLLFVGSLYIVEDGFWINNDQLLIVGQFDNEFQTKVKSFICFVDIEKNIIQTFEYRNWIDMHCDYLEKIRYPNIIMAE